MSDDTYGLGALTSDAAERGLIGAALRWPDRLDDYAESVSPDDFRDPDLGLLWGGVRHLWVTNRPVGLLTLREEMLRRKELAEREGDRGYSHCPFVPLMAELHEAEPTGGMAAEYARVVREGSLFRGLVRAAHEILRDATNPVGPAREAVERAEKRIFALSERGTATSTVSLYDAVREALEDIDARQKSRAAGETPPPLGVPTGIAALEGILGAFRPRELIVIAARPSIGKTAVAMACATAAAAARRGVYLASIEMGRRELAVRTLSAGSGVEGRRVREADLNEHECADLLEVRNGLADAQFSLSDDPSQTVLAIAARCRRLKRLGRLDVVFVDYLQLVEADAKRGVPRHEQVAEISRRLKQLARELEVPVVALAQINREADGRVGGTPRLSDIKESGQVEQDADVVILLHRRPESPDLLDMIVAKQRNGPTGEVTVAFDRERMKIGKASAAARRPVAPPDEEVFP